MAKVYKVTLNYSFEVEQLEDYLIDTIGLTPAEIDDDQLELAAKTLALDFIAEDEVDESDLTVTTNEEEK